MAKYIFSTKFKKIEKEPLYYNMQVSVDKDYEWDNDVNLPSFFLYKDQPITLQFVDDVPPHIEWRSNDSRIRLQTGPASTHLLICGMMECRISDGTYPLPETVSVVHDGVTFTFTPIPVYE